MRKLRRTAALWLIPAVSAACHGNPVLVDDGNLTAELALSSAHAHTLSELELEVVIRNGDGYVVHDFEAVTVDRRVEGERWRSIDLEPAGDRFVGHYTFGSSGNYDMRVMVIRHGEAEPVEAPLAHGDMSHLQVARAHVELAGHRIEFETFPGHVHEGDEVEVKFWVLEPDEDASGHRPPVTGLAARVLCYELGEMIEEHDAHGHADGVYETTHVFAEAGDAAAALRFTDDHGNVIETSFDFHVVHGH